MGFTIVNALNTAPKIRKIQKPIKTIAIIPIVNRELFIKVEFELIPTIKVPKIFLRKPDLILCFGFVMS